MEGDLEVRFGPALRGTQHQKLIFQQIEGRLLAAEVQETIENTALGVLHGRDTRTLKVKVDQRAARQ